MARGVQVSKMGKRKRGKGWTTDKRKRGRVVPSSDNSYRSSQLAVRRPVFGFPDKQVTRFRYGDVYSLAGLGFKENVFKVNSCFDPDATGAGHQPMYFDQYCNAPGTAPYLKYRVLGSKITARFVMTSAPATVATNVAPSIVGVVLDQNITSLITTASQAIETSRCNYGVLQDKSGSFNEIVLTNTYSPTRDLGFDVGDDTLAASYNADPSQLAYWHAFRIDQSATTTVTVYVEIEYLVELFQRNEINQS